MTPELVDLLRKLTEPGDAALVGVLLWAVYRLIGPRPVSARR